MSDQSVAVSSIDRDLYLLMEPTSNELDHRYSPFKRRSNSECRLGFEPVGGIMTSARTPQERS